MLRVSIVPPCSGALLALAIAMTAALCGWPMRQAHAQWVEVVPARLAGDCPGGRYDPAAPGGCAAAARPPAAQRRKPFLRVERVQLCLRMLGIYNGPVGQRRPQSTSRAVQRFASRYDIWPRGDELTDRAVQARLVVECRTALAAADRERALDPATRCGTAAIWGGARRGCLCRDGHERFEGLCLPRVASRQVIGSGSARVRSAKARRPLLRTARVQQCLRGLGLYGGRINGARNPATLEALERFMSRHKVAAQGQDELKDRAVQDKLAEACKATLAEQDRTTAKMMPAAAAPADLRMSTSPAPLAWDRAEGEPVCLPPELKMMLVRGRPGRTDVPVCPLPCLAPPSELKAHDLAEYESKAGVSWCKSCVPYSGYLALEDVLRIERAGRLTLCRYLTRGEAGEQRLEPQSQALKGARALFSRRLASEQHGNIAIVISNQRYLTVPPLTHAYRDGTAMYALLTERLGYQHQNVIEVRDATLATFERMLGTPEKPRGELADKLKEKSGPAPGILLYFAGRGSFRHESGEAFLLPVDATPKREPGTGYALAHLVEHLAKLGAPTVTVLLEADFNRDPTRLVFSPNAPETMERLLPATTRPGVSIMTAADRDQRTLEDPEYGLGLFTRHLIEGMSGAADAPPIGNGDRRVEIVELYVHVAHRVGLAARKSFGVMQKPTLWHRQRVVVSRLLEVRR
jgi:hypothetical protein